MQASKLTSRLICKIFKGKDFECQLNIFKESAPELATVWIHNGRMWWMIEGVWGNTSNKNIRENYDSDIQFKAQILFEDRKIVSSLKKELKSFC